MRIAKVLAGFVYLQLFYVMECHSNKGSNVHLGNVKDDNICNRTTFFNKYVVQDVKIDRNERLLISTQCAANLTCSVPTLTLYYAQNTETKEFYFYVSLSDLLLQKFKDCWGYLLEMKTKEGVDNFYFNFENKSDTHAQLVYVKPNVSYQITLTTFPNGEYSWVNIRGPSLCENRILTDMPQKVNELLRNCPNDATFDERLEVAESVCLLYPDSIRQQHYAVTYLLSEENCHLVLSEPKPSFTSVIQNKKPLELVIPLGITSFLLFLLVVYTLVNLIKKKMTTMVTSTSNDHLLQAQSNLQYTTEQDPKKGVVTTSFFKSEDV